MLSKIPSWLFIILYIGSIYIFAIIYYSLPYEFYHSTSKYEPGLRKDVVIIEEGLGNAIKSYLHKSHPSGSLKINNLSAEIDSITLSIVDAKDFEATFALHLVFIRVSDSTKFKSTDLISVTIRDFYAYE